MPELGQPGLIVFERGDGRYQEVAHVTGDEAFTASRPFPVRIVPSQLVAGLRPG